MSWLSRVLRPKSGSEALPLLKLRVTRFRQLLGTRGAFLALIDDAAEKQGGSFILDRQYVIALTERVAELTDAALYDLDVITSRENPAFHEVAERLRADLRGVIAPRSVGRRERESEPPAPHDRTDRPASEEEEYRLLRSVRESAFPLTLARDPIELSPADCRTLHDLVHLALGLAGDALGDLLTNPRVPSGVLVRFEDAPGVEARALFLTGSSPAGSNGSIALSDLPSRPLRAFLDGLFTREGSGRPVCTLQAAATDEHCLAVTALQRGFDMLDATVSDAPGANTVYCRFAPLGESDPEAARGALASEALARLGFSVSVTGHEVSGWIRGLARPEAEECVRSVGILSRRLAEVS